MENKNGILAIILSAVILITWTWFYEKPKMEEAQIQAVKEAQLKKDVVKTQPETVKTDVTSAEAKPEIAATTEAPKTSILLDQKTSLAETATQRISIESEDLSGSINLQGFKFDNLRLNKYTQTIDKNSDKITLFAPTNTKERYFADFGWVGSDNSIELPDANTVWSSNGKKLTPTQNVILSWQNTQNILFTMEVSMDKKYMFKIVKSVENLSEKPIHIASFGRVNKLLVEDPKSNYILHEGPMGVFDGVMTEVQYDDLEKANDEKFQSKKSWLGLTDKYWLAAIITNEKTTSTFSRSQNSHGHIYNVNFIGEKVTVAPQQKIKLTHQLFAGAKEVTLLDEYAKEYDIELFDRAVDFGWYYFLTKPFFFILKFFNDLFGNYGLAILAITVLVKLAMLPLAAKSYKAMARIKKLGPDIDAIKKKNKDSKMQMNKEVMELYKREKINPAAGCLPMLIQIPVFFSLYKVLFVTIDMRHQPFFGWIKDLSAPDPTSIFNLFGLLPFEIHGGILLIGVWPILMGITMFLQQKLGPKMSDPVQAKVMSILPFILIFIFAAFPAGLLIYWTWNNILSITQQYIITKKVERENA